MPSFYIAPVAESVPYDNTTSGLVSEDVQNAIDELSFSAGSSASPGFTFGRSGGNPLGTWLLCDTVPSNLAGRRVPLSGAKIVEVFSSNQNLDTYTLDFYSHDGNSVNLTFLSTLTIVAARGGSAIISVSVAKDKQIGIKVGTGSVNNVVAGFILKGSVA